MAGVLGVGYDITKWTDAEKDIAKAKIARFKDIRKTVQTGMPYRLVSPYENNRSVHQFVNPEQSESIIFVYNLAEHPNNMTAQNQRTSVVQLRGLLPDVRYAIEGMESVCSGDYLMRTGVEIPLRGAYKSVILKVSRQ